MEVKCRDLESHIQGEIKKLKEEMTLDRVRFDERVRMNNKTLEKFEEILFIIQENRMECD